MAEGNCVPRPEVSCASTPYLEIQPPMRVSVQVAAAMSRMDSASAAAGDRWQGAYDVIIKPMNFYQALLS